MKINSLPVMPIAALFLAVALSACGKTDMSSSTQTAASVSVASAPTVTTYTYTNVSTNTDTGTTSGPPLQFSFTLNGGQTAITPAFTTDNVLVVTFTPGQTEGNNFHSASMLEVVLGYNNLSFTPNYESSNYNFGLIGEQSNTLDLSNYISPGQNIQISVGSPQSDFYCTYAPNPFYYFDGTQYSPVNPLYNQYPGCYRSVPSTQQWSGTITVQTSGTSAI
jgi:hypothetical protein